jgi:hypothetical protein
LSLALDIDLLWVPVCVVQVHGGDSSIEKKDDVYALAGFQCPAQPPPFPLDPDVFDFQGLPRGLLQQ